MNRRTLLSFIGLLILGSRYLAKDGYAREPTSRENLLSAPLELGGEWGGSPPNDARAVISRMREVCLSDVRLLSDQQPAKLRVDDHTSVPPYIWLHTDHPDTAWIVVDIGARDWSKLCYQFGHELGHVLCNSWQWGAKPEPPTRWLEEAMVEAFSIRGLGLLATSWERDPPFPHDEPFAKFIREYRSALVETYRKGGGTEPIKDIGAWFRMTRAALEGGNDGRFGPAVVSILAELERDNACVEDMGAVNRWAARSTVPIEEYLGFWQASCKEVGASGRLPARLRDVFALR